MYIQSRLQILGSVGVKPNSTYNKSVGTVKRWVRYGVNNYKALHWNCMNADMQSIQAGEKAQT